MTTIEMRYAYEINDLIAEVACKAKVAMAMMEALRTAELLYETGVVIDGELHAVDCSNEILKLKAALRVVGVEDDEDDSGNKLGV